MVIHVILSRSKSKFNSSINDHFQIIEHYSDRIFNINADIGSLLKKKHGYLFIKSRHVAISLFVVFVTTDNFIIIINIKNYQRIQEMTYLREQILSKSPNTVRHKI